MQATAKAVTGPTEHVASYYAASRNDLTRYPVLKGQHSADVCVIGGGFSGIAAALTLAERGYKVVVLEARQIGWGASGRNGGQLIYGISGEARIEAQHGAAGRDMLRAIRYRGHDIIHERIARYNIDCDYQPGWIEVAARPKHVAALRAAYDARMAENDGCGGGGQNGPDQLAFHDRESVAALLGTDAYHAGFLDRRSGHLHPLNLVLGEARAAASLGVGIYENSAAIKMVGGAKPYVCTADGRVDVTAIILAGGTDHSFNRGRLNGVMFPTGSYIITTAPLPPSLAARINPENLAVADSRVVLDYYRTTTDQRMVFGGRCNYSNRDPKDLAADLAPRLHRIYPELADIAVEFAWSGRIGVVVSRVPIIARVEPNVYAMQGYCGHGVNASHIAAEIIADAFQGTTERFDLFDTMAQWRLPVGRWAGNQMLALGMLYYRLRDRL